MGLRCLPPVACRCPRCRWLPNRGLSNTVYVVQGGNGVTDNRDGFHFLWAGVHAGRSPHSGPLDAALLRANLRVCRRVLPLLPGVHPQVPACPLPACRRRDFRSSVPSPTRVGGTYTGMSLTPILLRLNLARHRRRHALAPGRGWRPLDQPQVPRLRRHLLKPHP